MPNFAGPWVGMIESQLHRWRALTGWMSRVSLWAVVAAALGAEPYTPAHDDEVLETLPRSLVSSELTTLRRQLQEAPSDVELASRVAGRYLEMGNLEGDPRFYGYARAAILPWWQLANPPPTILRLRAKLKEKEHLYDEALADLNELLKVRPRDAQAWIELANIYRVQGRYPEAWQACTSLSEFADELPVTLCRVPLQAATGHATEAYESLQNALTSARTEWPSTVPWLLTMQAKIAVALGRKQAAEQHFLAGLAAQPGDSYLRREYADFLLDEGREDEVVTLLRDHTNDEGVLLLAAIAAQRAGESALAAQWQSELEVRFQELRLRGGQPHGRFEARFECELRANPQRGLAIALANWQKQKEVRDTRNVLEAAIAAQDIAAAQPVLEFLAAHGTEDVVLDKLTQQLRRR